MLPTEDAPPSPPPSPSPDEPSFKSEDEYCFVPCFGNRCAGTSTLVPHTTESRDNSSRPPTNRVPSHYAQVQETSQELAGGWHGWRRNLLNFTQQEDAHM